MYPQENAYEGSSLYILFINICIYRKEEEMCNLWMIIIF